MPKAKSIRLGAGIGIEGGHGSSGRSNRGQITLNICLREKHFAILKRYADAQDIGYSEAMRQILFWLDDGCLGSTLRLIPFAQALRHAAIDLHKLLPKTAEAGAAITRIELVAEELIPAQK